MSGSEEEELESSALLEGLGALSFDGGLSLGVISDSLRVASRAFANCVWVGDDSEAGIWFNFGEAFCTWYTVFVDEFLDMRAPIVMSEEVRIHEKSTTTYHVREEKI